MKNLQTTSRVLSLLLTAAMAACGAGHAIPVVPGAVAAPSFRPDVNRVALRSAGSFAILAGTTITNTGKTQVTGNVGIFPGTAITGFPPGVINGTLYAADAVAKQAEMDLTVAYNSAMGQVRNPILIAGNLGGRTLKPGLYKSTSGLAVSSGDLTLDAGGNANAVWVFQMATGLNMTTGRKVFLTHGAKAQNVFWAVGSSATFGTGCSFYGNLIVYKSISLATGSVMVGRALARIGAVTMQGNSIVRPVP